MRTAPTAQGLSFANLHLVDRDTKPHRNPLSHRLAGEPRAQVEQVTTSQLADEDEGRRSVRGSRAPSVRGTPVLKALSKPITGSVSIDLAARGPQQDRPLVNPVYRPVRRHDHVDSATGGCVPRHRPDPRSRRGAAQSLRRRANGFPGRGGGPDRRRPALRLLVHPRLGPMETAAAVTPSSTRSATRAGRRASWRWPSGQTRCSRSNAAPPITTAAGKILHLHQDSQGQPIGSVR